MPAAIETRLPPRVNSPELFPPPPRPREPAHVIASDEEALVIARRLAAKFAEGAAVRDRDSLVLVAEVEAFSQSGLWDIRVPRRYGGAEASVVTVVDCDERCWPA